MSKPTSKYPFQRSAGNYDVEAASNEAAIPADEQGESLTVQSMAEDTDLNVLMKRFGVTGQMPQNVRVPQYGDFTGINDYQTALNAVADAQEEFMRLPAELRARFQNNPQMLLEFVADDGNIEEARKLGLLKETPRGSEREGSNNGDGRSGASGTARDRREDVPRSGVQGAGGAEAGGAIDRGGADPAARRAP